MTEAGKNNEPIERNGPHTPRLIQNPISLIGIALAAVASVTILFLFVMDFTQPHVGPYIGILAYMVGPAFLIVGLLLVVGGVIYERRRRARAKGKPHYLRIDLNNPAQRSTAAFILSFVAVFALISAIGSYKAYEFTDSNQFCGQLCHTVMHPEYTAYQASPHARVGCVECHVGSGASWYVKSKLSGLRQVYYTAMGTFPRPIPTPVHDLRPAEDTCEQCHWPKKFWGAQLKTFTHFAPDEYNTPRVIRMLIKIGGGDPNLGQAGEGIHWHMNIANRISYYASDEQRQVIPYVRVENIATGAVTEYLARATSADIEKTARTQTRRLDCIDCHNRPTHVFTPPDLSIDRSIVGRSIDHSLPYIKQEGVRLLTADYHTAKEAEAAIGEGIQSYYREKYPDIANSKRESIQRAAEELQRIYRTTFFPSMKVNWKTHPNNSGDFYYPGCFRCHDGDHVSKDGEVITKDCSACHTLVAQETGSPTATIPSERFDHPVDLGDLAAVNCSDCHTGGVAP